MNSMNEPVLIQKIRLLDSYAIVSEKKKVCQILFDGHADGKYFQGDILPGAVDTQMIEPVDGGKGAGGSVVQFFHRLADRFRSDPVLADSFQM